MFVTGVRVSAAPRVVLGVSAEAVVLPAAVGGADPVLRVGGLVRVHLLQHAASPLPVRRLHPAGREGLQLPVHRGTATPPDTPLPTHLR